MVKIKVGYHGLRLVSLLNSITHLMLPFSSGFLIAYATILKDTTFLMIGASILLPLSIFDITFEEAEQDV